MNSIKTKKQKKDNKRDEDNRKKENKIYLKWRGTPVFTNIQIIRR